MIGVTVRNNGEVDLGKVNVEGLDVVLENFRVVASVEEDALAVVLDEGGKAPVFRERFVVGKRVIQNRNAILGFSMPRNCKQEKSYGEPEESANNFHREPPGEIW